jgi:hypothetical protein
MPGITADDDGETDEFEEFQTALLEIKAQGPYVGAYREQLERVDAFVRGRVREARDEPHTLRYRALG